MKRLALALAAVSLACSAGTNGAPAEPPAACRGPGRYEVGKGDQYLPCCAGSHEIEAASAVEQGEPPAPACTHDLPLLVYACVKGTCGDGICEPGESPRCGCAADCPSAAWGEAK